MVHTLDEVPPVRAAVEDAGGFLRVARVEAAGCRYGIVIGARWEDLWWGITTHAERSEFAYTRVVACAGEDRGIQKVKVHEKHVHRLAVI